MERKIEKQLLAWKNAPDHLPLVLHGARQVGKTYTLLKFGKENYREVVYLNFESNTRLHTLFENDISPSVLVPLLSLFSGKKITEHDTLVIFDEIQACERALTSLKYFAEEAPLYHVVAAGSLLGVALHREKFSFPVGKVQLLNLFPMDLEEFFWARGMQEGSDMIRDCYRQMVPCALHDHFLGEFKTYIALGGMPRVISQYLENPDFDYVTSIQKEIHAAYLADMAKYAAPTETVRIMGAYASIPAQLTKQNRKFQYKLIKSGSRAHQYETPIEWLKAAGLVVRVNKCSKPEIPVLANAEPDFFKLYLFDTGMLCSVYGINATGFVASPMDLNGIKGVLAENYVATSLQSNGYTPYYWESEGKAEVDFIIQNKQGEIIPVEVKSSENVRARSLANYIARYKPSKAFKITAKNFGMERNQFSVPLYATFCI